MRYTVTKQQIQVLGYIWQPGMGICAGERFLTSHELARIANPKDRIEVLDWIKKNYGDFSEIVDFRADFHIFEDQILHEWERGVESEIDYNTAMFPEEEG